MSDLQSNLDRLRPHLDRFAKGGVMNRITGRVLPAASGATFNNSSPVDETHICSVARSDARDIDTAAQAAKRAFPVWRDMPGTERKQILHRIADAIVARADEIAMCECWDTGQAFRFMSKAALRGAENFRFFADRAPSARDGQMLPSQTLMNVTTRVPIGPVGVITPWNTPFMLSTWKIRPVCGPRCSLLPTRARFSRSKA